MQAEINLLRAELSLAVGDFHSGKRKKPKTTRGFRMIWVLNSRFYTDSYRLSAFYTKRTIAKWVRDAFRIYWRRKSKPKGRPPISSEVRRLIRDLHVANPAWSSGRIRDQLMNQNVTDVPSENTIKKYLKELPPPDRNKKKESSGKYHEWLRENAHQTWGMDLFTVATRFFRVLYVLVIIHHGTRRIVHFAVTPNPNLFWMMQQFREATPFGDGPKYLVHDNEPIFVSKAFQKLLQDTGVKSVRTAKKAPWQNPYAERVIGSIRRELLDLNPPWSQKHLQAMLKEYIFDYYNTERTHQGIGRTTPVPSPDNLPTTMAETKLEYIPILSGMYHKLRKVS